MSKKYHAVFFTDMGGKFYHVRPLGAYRLASELRSHGYEVLVVDYLSDWLNNKEAFIKLLANIISKETLFVGYSSTFFSDKSRDHIEIDSFEKFYGGLLSDWPVPTREIASINKLIKKLNPNIKILHGGASTGPYPSMKDAGVDYVVQGLADRVIVEIADALKNKTHIKFNLKNNIKVIDHDVKGASFSFPTSSTIFHPSDFVSNNEVLPLETSRGCLFKCSFCSFPLLGRKKNNPDYLKQAQYITDEIKRNFELYGITNYMFVDDTFNESTEKLQNIYTAIKNSGVKINFHCYLRLDLIERFPEQIQLLKDMGIQSCFLGIETLNLEAAKSIGKSSEPVRVKETLKKMKQVWGEDAVIYGSFIAGLPNETEETIDEWMQWVYNEKDLIDGFVIRALFLTANKLSPSDINRNPEKYGYNLLSDKVWYSNTGMSVFAAKSIAEKWMEKAWSSNRLKIAGHELMALLGLGYTFADLRILTLNKLPFNELIGKHSRKFITYKQHLERHIGLS